MIEISFTCASGDVMQRIGDLRREGYRIIRYTVEGYPFMEQKVVAEVVLDYRPKIKVAYDSQA